MKSFSIRVIVFACLCAFIFGGWAYALYRLELQSYFREVHIPKKTQVVVCGDSHLECGFDTRCWPGSFNFALSALTLDQLELKVYGLLKENPNYRGLVIVDISPEKLFNPNVNQLLVEAGPPGKRLMLHWLYPEMNRRALDGMIKLFRDAILVKRTKKAWKAFTRGKTYQSSIGGYGVRDGAIPGPNEMKVKEGFRTNPDDVAKGIASKANTINGSPEYMVSSRQHEIIVNIVRIIREHGCRPLIVTTPLHAQLLSAIDHSRLDAFGLAMAALTKELNIPYVDTLRWEYPDDCWLDGNHLNGRGAIFYTRQLKREIENVL